MGKIWANEVRANRLQATVQGDVLRFWDLETGEAVRVEQVYPEPWKSAVSTFRSPLTALLPQLALKGQQVEGVTLRDVWQFATAEHCQALRIGLTWHRSWFSSTPHTFELKPEPGFEEMFYFRSSVPGAKALVEGEGLWQDGTVADRAWPVRDRQFLQIPMGSHRVCVLPVEDEQRPEWWYWWAYLALHERWEKGR